jgi:hypothetical protein
MSGYVSLPRLKCLEVPMLEFVADEKPSQNSGNGEVSAIVSIGNNDADPPDRPPPKRYDFIFIGEEPCGLFLGHINGYGTTVSGPEIVPPYSALAAYKFEKRGQRICVPAGNEMLLMLLRGRKDLFRVPTYEDHNQHAATAALQ